MTTQEPQAEQKSQAEQLIELAMSDCKLFKDQYGIGYALAKVGNHYESMALKCDRFRLYLVMSYRKFTSSKPPNESSINNAIQTLQAEAEYNSKTIPLHIRVAWSEDKKSIYYDLADEHWTCIKISKDKVDFLLGPDVNFPLFKRYSQTIQPIPESRREKINPQVFDKFMSLTNVESKDDILLTKVWIVCAFIPDITHAILNVHGGQDAAKTTFQKLVKQLVDPDNPKNLLSVSSEKMEFIQQISHRHIAFYDNLKLKPRWLPEEICKAVTGGGTTKRELFTNEGDVIFNLKTCLGFNGINMIMVEPDVLRRSIIIELLSINEEDKIEENKIFSTMEEMKSALLGYIFNIISKAMVIKESIKMKGIPGIVDFALWGEAISRVMGYKEMEFIEAYRRNIKKQNEHVVESDPFAKAITLLCDELESEEISNIKTKFSDYKGPEFWSISTNGFVEELRGIAIRNGLDTTDGRFPQAANKVANRLNVIRTNIRGKGIEIVIRQSRVKEDIDNGFPKNTSIVDIKFPTPCSDSKDSKDTIGNPYVNNDVFGKDSKDSKDTLGNLNFEENSSI